jgi:hypothetical protein
MKRPAGTDERDAPNPQHEQVEDSVAEESDIDQILADSFPASDAPSWTLGVASRRRTGVRRRKDRRG